MGRRVPAVGGGEQEQGRAMPVLGGEVTAQEGQAPRGEGGMGQDIQRSGARDRQIEEGDQSAAEE